MSDEGGVTPTDVARDAAAQPGNTRRVQRCPGHLAVPWPAPGLSAGCERFTREDEFRMQTRAERGVHAPAFKLHWFWAGSERTSQGQNRTREIRPSGIVGGLAETWTMVELGTRRTTERVRAGHSPPKVVRAAILSRPYSIIAFGVLVISVIRDSGAVEKVPIVPEERSRIAHRFIGGQRGQTTDESCKDG